MKHRLVPLILSLSLLTAGPTLAHSEHGKPQHGGIVAEGGTFQAELVAKPEVITLYLSEHEKQLASKGATVKLVLLNGAEKSEATLQAAGDNKLEARGPFKVGAGTKIVATITLPGKAPQSLRYALP